jgi:pyruvate dehydrogenase E1 component
MFGFQRVGDLAWAAGDSQARGFLLGGTAGRTTLNGEGLQHQDGHGHLLASTIPNCVSYDPCYTYELAVIIQDGLRRMIRERENVFYYVTVMNEPYLQPALPDDADGSTIRGILQGMYKLRVLDGSKKSQRVRLLGAGAILREVEAAAEILQQEYDLTVEVFSVTSFTELAREGQDTVRWNLLHAEQAPKESYVQQQLAGDAPVIVASDYVKSLAEQIRSLVPTDMHVLGTDGFGRSDTRELLRHFFEVDRKFVVLAALKSLADQQRLPVEVVAKARDDLGIDPDKSNPRKV